MIWGKVARFQNKIVDRAPLFNSLYTGYILKSKTMWTSKILGNLLAGASDKDLMKSIQNFVTEQLYTCQICKQDFKNINLLKRHDLIHTGLEIVKRVVNIW